MWVLSGGVSARGDYLKARCLCGASAHISGETGQRGHWQFGLLGTGSVHAKRCYYYQTRSRCRPLHVKALWQRSDCGRQTGLSSAVWILNVAQQSLQGVVATRTDANEKQQPKTSVLSSAEASREIFIKLFQSSPVWRATWFFFVVSLLLAAVCWPSP